MNWNKLKLKKLLKSQAVRNELIKYIPHHSLTIFASKPAGTELIPIKMVIKSSLITVFERQNSTKTKVELPRVIKINITEEASNYIISIAYFNKIIATFNWYDVRQIPTLTDAIKELLDVKFQTAKQIYKNTEALIFHSKIDTKTHQIFKLRDNKTKFHLDFKDQVRTKITFDWRLYRLQLQSLKLKNKVEVSFLDIDKINLVLRESIDFYDFDLLEITIEGTAFGIKKIVRIETIFDEQYQPKSLFKISPKLTFNAIQNMINLLKNKIELAEIELDFSVV